MIVIGADHRGYKLKEYLKKHYEVLDVTPDYIEGDDYPIITKKVLKKIKDFAIIICGSGIGVAMAANRNKKVRAVNACDLQHAVMARKHEDANVLCLGADYLTPTKAKKIVDAFLKTTFEGGRHLRRVKML